MAPDTPHLFFFAGTKEELEIVEKLEITLPPDIRQSPVGYVVCQSLCVFIFVYLALRERNYLKLMNVPR